MPSPVVAEPKGHGRLSTHNEDVSQAKNARWTQVKGVVYRRNEMHNYYKD